MQWELREVKDTECQMDDSGVYVVISRVVTRAIHKEYAGERVRVRADVMSNRDLNQPIMSFIGTANAVRKAIVRFLKRHYGGWNQPSMEHASYIGYELHRAETDPHFIQD